MSQEVNIENVLVLLNPELIRPADPLESPLLRRATSLAKITGCKLDLFHVCYDGGLDHGLFRSDAELQRERERLTDRDTTRLAELATRLKPEGVDVDYEVRWDYPRVEAILRKIAESRPGIVMKQARESSYFLGMASNTDWELARRSPSHVWLVNDEIDDIDRIVAAVGNKFGDPNDITTAADYDLLRTAGAVGAAFEADVFPVNAYQLPVAPRFVTGDGVTSVWPAEYQEASREQTVKQHGAAVKALAKYFDIPRRNVHICEGYPNQVIPDVSRTVNADMIVMGAKSIGRLERLVTAVTVEPVLSAADCDILVVRERDLSRVPEVATNPYFGTPKCDVERAITNPDDTFDSPQEVAQLEEVSIDLRKRMLQAWEYYVRAEMTEENEGGAVRDIDVDVLNDIQTAKAQLEMEGNAANNEQIMRSELAA